MARRYTVFSPCAICGQGTIVLWRGAARRGQIQHRGEARCARHDEMFLPPGSHFLLEWTFLVSMAISPS